ncbi:hypothetical protein VP01_2541g2 [Puccinia sorghi]|uniref:Uncharacterized protein n=1 Tax=Puccinia sorghi TaxID=27349 RepID=A0A0L6V5X1_9BASI|nr:hypothetical protein VP01_2541g2 [Puccinia sorghi]
MEAPRKTSFMDIIRATCCALTNIVILSAPCLSLISHLDALWTSGKTNYDHIRTAFKKLENLGTGEHPSGSWLSIMIMFLWQDDNTTNSYINKPSLRSLICISLEKINQCANKSVVQVSSKSLPNIPQNINPDLLEGTKSAGSFLN